MTLETETTLRDPSAPRKPTLMFLGSMALVGVVACGGGAGGSDSDAEDGTGGADAAESGAGAGTTSTGTGSPSGSGGSEEGSGGAAADCSGNPVDGAEKSAVVHQLAGVTVSTFAGSSEPGTADGPADEARFFNPVNVVVDGDDLLIADFDNGLIRRATAGGTISTLVMQDGFARPFGLALGSDRLFVQSDNDTQGEFAGPGGSSLWSVDPASGEATPLFDQAGRPRGMAVLSTGELAVADVGMMTMRLLDADAESLASFAGGADCPSFRDGSGDEARFDHPYGVVALEGGDMLVADMGNHRIRRISRDGEVSSFAGDGVAGMIDGDAAEARFDSPKDLAIDAAGNVYVSDVGNHRIRRVRPDGMVETIAGDGTAGFADGSGEDARFFGQEGLDVTADGTTLYVADGTGGEIDLPYHRVRKITLP